MARKGYSGGSNGSNSCLLTSSGGGSGSSITSYGYANNQHYLKPTQVGFDSFFSISKYPSGDGSGVDELYNFIGYLEIRYTSNYTDGDNFWTIWDSASSIHVTGSTSNTTTNYASSVGVGNYLHHTPVLADGNSYHQLVVVKYYNSAKTYSLTFAYWDTQKDLYLLSAPAVSFSQSTNNFTVTGGSTNAYRIIEFNRPSYSPFSAYASQEEIDIFYNCSARNQEFGLYYGQGQNFENFNIWEPGNYLVKLEFNSSHPESTMTRFSNAVNNWISITNTALSGSGVSFTRNDSTSYPSILIQTKSNYDMGSSSGYTYAGHWYTTIGTSGYITGASIELNYEIEYYDGLFTTVEAVTTEELYESLGCGGDLTTRADCINSDFNWYGKTNGNYSSIETHILQLMYLSDLKNYVGADAERLAVICNPSNGFTSTLTNTANALWMVENVTYNLRIWQVNGDNTYSVVTSYSQTFTPINYPTIPSSPTISSRFQGGYNLTWTGTNSYSYKLGYSTDNINWNYYYPSTNSYIFNGLSGQTYYLKVKGISQYNKPDSAYSSVNLGTTQAGIPQTIDIIQSGQTHTVDVDFIKGYSASGYTVYTDIDFTKTNGSWDAIDYTNQTGDNYNIDVTDYTITYFRLRAKITVSGTDIYSDWCSTIAVTLIDGNVYYWNGSSWVLGEVHTWNGSSWVKATQVYSWSGSSWV